MTQNYESVAARDLSVEQLLELVYEKKAAESKQKKAPVEPEENGSTKPTLRECLLWLLEEEDLQAMLNGKSTKAELIAQILRPRGR